MAVAALEPHFAARLCGLMGMADEAASPARANAAMLQPATHQRVASFMATRTRQQLDRLADAAKGLNGGPIWRRRGCLRCLPCRRGWSTGRQSACMICA